jgi:hypothetical protein
MVANPFRRAVKSQVHNLEIDEPHPIPGGFEVTARLMSDDPEEGPAAAYRGTVSRVRHDGPEIHAELVVVADGIQLLRGPWVVTSLTSRREVQMTLGVRDAIWPALLNALAGAVTQARRLESQIVRLRDVVPSEEEAWFEDGPLPLMLRYPNIWFGQGGTCKSLLALKAAGELAKQRVRVLYLDWELDAQAHQDRLARLYPGGELPDVLYWHADMPLAHLVVDLREVIQRERIEFLVCDSIGFAIEGAAETSAAARTYGNALRALGVGSLSLAHVTKPAKGRAEEGSRFPFGSIFWHNVARCTWNLVEDSATSRDCTVMSAMQRKWSMDAQRPDHTLAVRFEDGDGRTIEVLRRVSGDGGAAVATAKPTTILERLVVAIQEGCRTREAVVSRLGSDKPDSVRAKLREGLRSGRFVEGADGALEVGARQ